MVTIHQKSSVLDLRCNSNPRVIKRLNSTITPSTSFHLHYSLSPRHSTLHKLCYGQCFAMNNINSSFQPHSTYSLLVTVTLDHKHTLGRTPLDERWILRRGIYLTTHKIHNRRISVPSAGFEPAIAGRQRLLKYTGTKANGQCLAMNNTHLSFQPHSTYSL